MGPSPLKTAVPSEAAIAAIEAINAVSVDGFGDAFSRLSVLNAARGLITRLETPTERALSFNFTHPVLFAAVQTFVDLGIWEAWVASGDGSKAAVELVELAKSPIEIGLLRRLIRLLVAVGILVEVGEDNYGHTAFSLALGQPDECAAKMIQAGTHHWLDAGRHLPEFLRKTQYKECTDRNFTAYSDMAANPEHLSFFARCQAYPAFNESFGGHMAGWTKCKRHWTDIMDTRDLLDHADLTQGPLVVDIGGLHGADIARVLQKHPDLPAGSLVLQDLPEVIEVARTKKLDPRITTQAFDFFQPQPVRNSRAYFMHAVLHDWPDHAALEIFENLKPAMKRGYSKLLINEIVIPPTGASLFQAVLDVQMMTLLSALERTESHWRELLTRAGFTNLKIFHDDIGLEAVIEAELL